MEEPKDTALQLVMRMTIYGVGSVVVLVLCAAFVAVVFYIGKSMGLSNYLWAKLIWGVVLVVGVGLACFFYRLITGKDLRDKFREPPNEP